MSRREPINIMLRRRADDRHVEAVRNLAETNKLGGIAAFTASSDYKVKAALMKRKVAEQNARMRAQLDERRRKLAMLLTAERAQFERDIEDSFETPEQVKERMFAYARRLKEENDAERRRLREELERKRFIAGSDVLRARASEIISERTALDRLAQLQEKQRAREAEAERERAEEAARAKDVAAFHSKAAIEAEARRRFALEMRGALDAQVAVRRALTATEAEYERGVESRMLEEDRAAAEALRGADAARRAAERDEFARTMRYNAAEAAVKGRAEAAEAAADVAELEAGMRREAEAIAREKAAVEARKAETVAFRRTLAEQMQRAAAETGWMDKFYAEEQEKVWAKRQATWDAEAGARKSLMAEVAAARLEQIEERAATKVIEKERDAVQAAASRAAHEAAEARERAKVEERRRLIEAQAEVTRAQLEERRRRAEAEKQAEYLTWRLQQKEEREYAARVAAALKDPATFRR